MLAVRAFHTLPPKSISATVPNMLRSQQTTQGNSNLKVSIKGVVHEPQVFCSQNVIFFCWVMVVSFNKDLIFCIEWQIIDIFDVLFDTLRNEICIVIILLSNLFFACIACILLRLKLRVECWKSSPMIYVSLDRELNFALNDIQITGDDFQHSTHNLMRNRMRAIHALKEARNIKVMLWNLWISAKSMTLKICFTTSNFQQKN